MKRHQLFKFMTCSMLALLMMGTLAKKAIAQNVTECGEHCAVNASAKPMKIKVRNKGTIDIVLPSSTEKPPIKVPIDSTPSPTTNVVPEPTREDINDLMKMTENNLELTNQHEDRIQALEEKPSIPGPRGPKGDDGGKSVTISGGFALQSVFSRGDSQEPNYAGGLVGSIGAGSNPKWMVDLSVNLGTGQCHGRYSNGSLGIRRVMPWSASIGIGGYGSYCSMVTKPHPEMDQPGDEIGSSHFIGGYTALGLHPHKGLFVKAQVNYGLRTVPAMDDIDRYKDVEVGISLGYLWGN